MTLCERRESFGWQARRRSVLDKAAKTLSLSDPCDSSGYQVGDTSLGGSRHLWNTGSCWNLSAAPALSEVGLVVSPELPIENRAAVFPVEPTFAIFHHHAEAASLKQFVQNRDLDTTL